jgi:hypothetical protein
MILHSVPMCRESAPGSSGSIEVLEQRHRRYGARKGCTAASVRTTRRFSLENEAAVTVVEFCFQEGSERVNGRDTGW